MRTSTCSKLLVTSLQIQWCSFMIKTACFSVVRRESCSSELELISYAQLTNAMPSMAVLCNRNGESDLLSKFSVYCQVHLLTDKSRSEIQTVVCMIGERCPNPVGVDAYAMLHALQPIASYILLDDFSASSRKANTHSRL